MIVQPFVITTSSKGELTLMNENAKKVEEEDEKGRQ